MDVDLTRLSVVRQVLADLEGGILRIAGPGKEKRPMSG